MMLLMPKSDVKMLDRWHVNGLRGTASFSFEVDNLFVPESHTYSESARPHESGPLYAIPKVPLFAMGFATIALVLARTCLEDAVGLASRKVAHGGSGLLRDQSTTQRLIGEGEATLRSSRAYLQQTAAETWQTACESGVLTMDQRIEVRMATTHAIRQASKVLDTAYDLFGTDAIFTSNPIQRRYQDMSVITQHVQSKLANYETAGRFFLGLEPGTIL